LLLWRSIKARQSPSKWQSPRISDSKGSCISGPRHY
jgi:hypothetical protein